MQAFSPVSNSKLYIQIYRQIHEAITSGAYSVGDKLPSEKELCQQFNVSRVPVREALCALELNGLVESIQGGGVYVKNTARVADEDVPAVEPQDIIRARMVLEPDMSREAALHITDEDRQALRDILDRFDIENKNGVNTVETDKAFHLCVARASGNALYAQIFDLIINAMEQAMWELILSRTISTKKYRDQNYREHRFIGEAIIEGRADEAYGAMKQHMEKLLERYWS